MLANPSFANRRPTRPTRAFTLAELLVVMAVIVLVVSMSGPAINALKSAGDVSQTVYDIAGILEQSRTYAMANNTYVYVGFGEADANTSAFEKQTFGDNTVGRVAVVSMATRDGSRGYDPNALPISTSWKSNYAQGRNLMVIGKVQTFSNTHLVDLQRRPTTGPMARPPYGDTNPIDPKYNLGNSGCQSVTPVYYPPGSDANSATYAFTKVIQIDPQGTATIQTDEAPGRIPQQIEIGLEPAHGNVAAPLTAPVTSGNVAALQMDGMLGSVRIYRP